MVLLAHLNGCYMCCSHTWTALHARCRDMKGLMSLKQRDIKPLYRYARFNVSRGVSLHIEIWKVFINHLLTQDNDLIVLISLSWSRCLDLVVLFSLSCALGHYLLNSWRTTMLSLSCALGRMINFVARQVCGAPLARDPQFQVQMVWVMCKWYEVWGSSANSMGHVSGAGAISYVCKCN